MPSTIMIIEDDEELNEILEYNLHRAGYETRQAWDGRKAITELEENPPDLVLLDVMLPGADGWEICRHMSAEPRLKTVPIIIFTAKSAREDFDQARQFNLAGFFTKPYATADVLRHVQKVLAARPA
ncbi:MAG: chemotaxis protein CheY [Armatimonadetes bacterium]|jgi:DNA-binding response OmpR family regulator|nr:chemotaxis protein CheY [Armatimonadota bacterium]